LSFHVRLRLSSGILPLFFQLRCYAFIIARVRATCAIRLIFPDLISLLSDNGLVFEVISSHTGCECGPKLTRDWANVRNNYLHARLLGLLERELVNPAMLTGNYMYIIGKQTVPVTGCGGP
jgi:hypothetical protein